MYCITYNYIVFEDMNVYTAYRNLNLASASIFADTEVNLQVVDEVDVRDQIWEFRRL